MRLIIAVCVISSAVAAAARDLPEQVSVSAGEDARMFTGTSSDGQTAQFEIKIVETGSLRFKISAENENCKAEMRTSSQLGYLPDFDRFPAQRSLSGKTGEIITLSFRQSRSAWMSKTQCAFSFSVGSH